MPHCDPFAASAEYRAKISKRQEQGLCPACGQEECKCKSTILSEKEWEKRNQQHHEQRIRYLSGKDD
jgi:hypothetical protein